MTRPRARTSPCGPQEARDRYEHAQRFLETAEVVLEDTTHRGYANVTEALAVLAGVAMADAVRCAALGRHHRGDDHRAASELLRRVTGGGSQMAWDLDHLLAIKDKASYQSGYLSRADARKAVGWARRMIEDGTTILQTGSSGGLSRRSRLPPANPGGMCPTGVAQCRQQPRHRERLEGSGPMTARQPAR